MHRNLRKPDERAERRDADGEFDYWDYVPVLADERNLFTLRVFDD